MGSFEFLATSEADTDRLGAALAVELPAGTVVALCGTLGAGKTRLVQAVAVACGVAAEEVISPTFVLCRQYEGRRRIYHLDAYRVRDDDEFLELGVDEMFAADALTFVEWGDRVAACLPDTGVEIQLTVAGPAARRFELTAHGATCEAALRRVANRLECASP